MIQNKIYCVKTQKVYGYLNIASGAPGVAGDIHRKKTQQQNRPQTIQSSKEARKTKSKKTPKYQTQHTM